MHRIRRLYIAVTVVAVVNWTVSVSVAGAVSEADEQAREIMKATEIDGGLIVHVGCGDGTLSAALRRNDRYIVHGLDTNVENVEAARRYLQSRGLYDTVAVDTFDGERLPYTDNLVNLLVVSKKYAVSEQEMNRVLTPRGVAYIETDNGWKKQIKAWPGEIDEWTHYLHGPDNNAVALDKVVGPPRHIQWLASPLWARNHHKLCSISAMVTAQGRIFCIVDEASAANINLPGKWSIMARDAFNGVLLWKKPMTSWAWHGIRFRSGPPQVARLLVASGDRVYVPLKLDAPISQLDAITGETLQTYKETGGAEEMVLVDDILVVLKGTPVAEYARDHPAFADTFIFPNRKTVLAVRIDTGETLWEWSHLETNPMPETLGSDGERVYFQLDETVVCLDLESGDTLWTSDEPDGRTSRRKLTYGQHTLVVKDGVVLCKLSEKLKAFSAEDGDVIWECEAGGGFHSPVDIFVIDGLVWQGMHVRDSVAPPPVDDFDKGRDLRTGEVKRTNSIMIDLQTAGHHHRCYREKATERYIITGKRGIEMMDLVGDNHSRNNWVRGTCQYGILPANGLIYAPPHACGCYMESKLWGFWALAADKTEVERIPEAKRLVKGPAYGDETTGQTPEGESWPQYRHDPLRSGVTSTAVPTQLEESWKTDIGGRLTQPVIAGNKVLVCSVDTDTVYALDEKNGETIWKYTAGGRIDSPPAVWKGKVLFGSADGWVYCLRLRDGELVWRFLAAATDRRTVVLDRVESVWPVHGSVLILDNVAYCSAGRSSWLDGGTDLYGLDPESGQVFYHNQFESRHPTLAEGKESAQPEHVERIDQNLTDYKTFLASDRSDSFSMAGGVISDVLVSNGEDVFLHHLRFDSNLEKKDRMMPHLFSTSGLLDGAENHRSHWVLGTGDFSRVPVAYPWIANRPGTRPQTIAVPTGVIMVYDDRAVWGIQRKGDATGEYFLFQKANKPFSSDEKSLPDFREIPKSETNACIWKEDFPVRTRAMLKSGDNLFLGVMPAEIYEDDPHAAYEGRKGGKIWVASAEDGRQLATYDLAFPVVWDGMAAANERLFLSTCDGCLSCYAGAK